MVISRIEIELASHGGNDNGRLPVTTDNFVQYGMHRTSVAPAIREAEALGFIRITERGHGGNAEYRSPNRFYLTYAHTRDSKRHPPTDEWRRIKTLQEADQIAKSARANKSTSAIERGKRSWRKRQQKTKSGTENTRVSVPKNSLETSESPVRDSGTTGSGGETELLSISRGGEHRDQPSSPSSPDHPKEGCGE
jgi:transposase